MKLIVILFLITFLSSCESNEHLREVYQKENPDCFVNDDLEVICSTPGDSWINFLKEDDDGHGHD